MLSLSQYCAFWQWKTLFFCLLLLNQSNRRWFPPIWIFLFVSFLMRIKAGCSVVDFQSAVIEKGKQKSLTLSEHRFSPFLLFESRITKAVGFSGVWSDSTPQPWLYAAEGDVPAAAGPGTSAWSFRGKSRGRGGQWLSPRSRLERSPQNQQFFKVKLKQQVQVLNWELWSADRWACPASETLLGLRWCWRAAAEAVAVTWRADAEAFGSSLWLFAQIRLLWRANDDGCGSSGLAAFMASVSCCTEVINAIITGAGRVWMCTFRARCHYGGSELKRRWRVDWPELLDEFFNYVSSW